MCRGMYRYLFLWCCFLHSGREKGCICLWFWWLKLGGCGGHVGPVVGGGVFGMVVNIVVVCIGFKRFSDFDSESVAYTYVLVGFLALLSVCVVCAGFPPGLFRARARRVQVLHFEIAVTKNLYVLMFCKVVQDAKPISCVLAGIEPAEL